MSFHDLHRLRRTSVTDVHAAEDSHRTGDQLRDFQITSPAELTVQCSSKRSSKHMFHLRQAAVINGGTTANR
jgi:hypothetical protein